MSQALDAAAEERAERRTPTVSVVVPTRDRPEQLLAAVGGILGQEYDGPIECVVVYDQSQIVPVPYVTKPGRTVLLVANDRTPGLAGARNSGVLAASGELIAFCDDDDEWLPGKLARQVDLLRDNPDVSLVACGVYVNFRGRDVARPAPDRAVGFDDFLRDRIMEINPCTALLPRAAMLETIGLVDEEIPGSYAEDYEWLLRATKHGPVLSVPDPLVRVNWHESSFFADRWATILKALDYLLERHPEIAQEPRGLARIEGQKAFAQAALGQRTKAIGSAWRSFTHHRRERRVVAALVVALGVARAETVLRWAHARGRGI